MCANNETSSGRMNSRRPAALMFALAVAASSAYGAALTTAVEGFLGIPVEPARWDYRVPSTILAPEGFSLSFGGGLADLLTQQHRGGHENHGYAVGVTGGALVGWDYGTTGIHVVGSGQSREWNDPEGMYRLTPAPKVGVMTITHAYQHGPWVLGATLYRSSFSVTDEFIFNRFPRSADPEVNRHLWDLIPNAVGNTIGYNLLGTHFSGRAQAGYRSPIGSLSIIGAAWTGELDGVLQYENTLSDTAHYRYLLGGYKEQTGWGDWDGTSIGGRWSLGIGSLGEAALEYEHADWSGSSSTTSGTPHIDISTTRATISSISNRVRRAGQPSRSPATQPAVRGGRNSGKGCI